MSYTSFQNKLIASIENKYGLFVTSVDTPPQGMSSSVFFIKTADGKECAIKYGISVARDVPALELIARERVDVPVPALIGSFVFENVPVLILERIHFPLLDSVSTEEMPKYIPSMIKNLRALHMIKSATPGFLFEWGNKSRQKTWKEMLLAIFEGGAIDWHAVAKRDGVDGELITVSVKKMIEKIKDTPLAYKEYSLLHTDFNQRNLFVNPDTHEVVGIIDWEEAMFGDPVYDFARIRMYLWHFNLGDQVIHEYYELMHFTPEQKKLEELYWLSRVIQYLGWYSEELNEFNAERIKLHESFLREYQW